MLLTFCVREGPEEPPTTRQLGSWEDQGHSNRATRVQGGMASLSVRSLEDGSLLGSGETCQADNTICILKL